MKGLSLTPPWGTLIAIAARFPALGKRIETRDWSTSYRGELAIHQTKGLGEFSSEAELWQHCRSEPFRTSLLAAGYGNLGQLPRGKIVAVVRVADCRPTRGSRPGSNGPKYADWVHELAGVGSCERAFGGYEPGRYGWLLAGIKALPEPIECRGMPGLWNVPADVEARIREQLK
jgi:hypothetical protein